jgi:hypothetical protein
MTFPVTFLSIHFNFQGWFLDVRVWIHTCNKHSVRYQKKKEKKMFWSVLLIFTSDMFLKFYLILDLHKFFFFPNYFYKLWIQTIFFLKAKFLSSVNHQKRPTYSLT